MTDTYGDRADRAFIDEYARYAEPRWPAGDPWSIVAEQQKQIADLLHQLDQEREQNGNLPPSVDLEQQLAQANAAIVKLGRIADQAEQTGRDLERDHWRARIERRAEAQLNHGEHHAPAGDELWHTGAHAALYWLAQDMRLNADRTE